MLAASVFCAFLAVATAAPLLDVPVPLPTLDPIFPGPESTVASRSSSTASSSSVSSTPSTSTATTSTPLPTTYPSPSPVAAYPSPEPVTGNSTGIHDPSMVKTPEGTYLVYGSGNWHSDTGVDVGLAIPTWSSPDRVAWTYLGVAFELPPPDTHEYINSTTAALWAPDVSYRNGQYWMYYSASFAGQMKSAVLLARSKSGLPGSWQDDGVVVATAKGCNWNAIDPNLLVTDDGKWYLSLGSYFMGIKILPLDPETGKLNGPQITVNPLTGLLNNANVTSLAARRHQIEGIEGSYIHYHESYFYLFTSWGVCCSGTTPSYNIRVVRSANVEGPYLDEAGNSALSGHGTEFLPHHDNVQGPGGQSLLEDGAGGLLMVYHYLKDSTTVPNLGINHVTYNRESGWPLLI